MISAFGVAHGQVSKRGRNKDHKLTAIGFGVVAPGAIAHEMGRSRYNKGMTNSVFGFSRIGNDLHLNPEPAKQLVQGARQVSSGKKLMRSGKAAIGAGTVMAAYGLQQGKKPGGKK